jgi:hypothetical protein
LTGHYAEIKTIEFKHKSKIKGKKKSETEFYYEVVLLDNFKELDDLKFIMNAKTLFDKADDKNRKLLQHYLPALTTWDNVMKTNVHK